MANSDFLNAMKKKYSIIILISSMFYNDLNAQMKYDFQWVLYNNSHLDFNNNSLKVDELFNPNKLLNRGEHSTNICDKNGKLLFSTGGCYILNSANKVMASGDSITSNFALANWCDYNDFPIIQCNTILPYPLDSNKFVIFNFDLEDPLGKWSITNPIKSFLPYC